MRCIKCHQETPATEMYCRNCGMKLNVSFDQITKQMGKEVYKEQMEETESFFRWILLLLLFIWLSGVLFNRLWYNPIQPKMTPAYIPTTEIPAESKNISHLLVIPANKE